ncbi:hypothetical protein MLD38_038632 [Melastoma candidum]|uniref:Uncharacterized protein n=1 Tax=Melastoma candidum TaxID=119954 RepID=A0ACB9KZI1_9MYRT|nr:hypothetical protein MLD38_038632 [Melastoma candidum]
MGSHSSNRTRVPLSRMAMGNGHGEDSPYFDGWKAYQIDPFDPAENPHGVIQMGLAENQLCADLIEEWLIDHPEGSICTAGGSDKFRDIANFQDYHGLPKFRNGIAIFMGKVRGNRVKFDPDRIVMSGGATGAHDLIAFCLADPGDAFLVPTPYYPGFDRDLCWRTGVKILPVNCKSSNNFKITKKALEEAYNGAVDAGIRVKGLIITNPSNPLGTTLDRATMKDLVDFVNEMNIHLVCDEIYAATLFRGPDFISIAEVIEEYDDDCCNRDLIHIIYSLSKDMGLPGFRIGIVYSYNDDVVRCGRKMSSFGLISSQTQHLIASMLSDDEFVERFIAESSARLAKRHGYFTHELERVGIRCLDSNAGLFVWMDLRELLAEQTFEAEMVLWRVVIHKVKLNVSPGSSFHCSEPGWYRVCIANMDDQTMEIALARIRSFVLENMMGNCMRVVRSKESKAVECKLKVSFSNRKMEEVMKMPCSMSPCSPMPPRSPLVRART